MFDTPEKRRNASKWFIGTVTCCVLVYLGLRHISNILAVISWFMGLAKPILIGTVFALILNVPMGLWEHFLHKHTPPKKSLRPVSIFLSLISVLGIFTGIAFLVIPELINAIKLIVQIIGDGLDQLAMLETNTALQEALLGSFLPGVNIDWLALKLQLEEWFKTQSGAIVTQAIDATKSLLSSTITSFIGLVFAVYILSGKEHLKRQACRLVRVWVPMKAGNVIIHIFTVCSDVFRRFVAGQTLEAIILGTLCMVGMAILQIPYATMIGALVGVTALIPVVGAFVGTIVGAVMIMTVNPFKAFVFVVFLLILQQVEGNLIYPRVVGSKINLPAIWVLAAVTICGNLAGPLGMLLGVPVASALYSLIREATDYRESCLAERPAS